MDFAIRSEQASLSGNVRQLVKLIGALNMQRSHEVLMLVTCALLNAQRNPAVSIPHLWLAARFITGQYGSTTHSVNRAVACCQAVSGSRLGARVIVAYSQSDHAPTFSQSVFAALDARSIARGPGCYWLLGGSPLLIYFV